MNNKAQNVCNCIINQLVQDGFIARGLVRCTCGDSAKNTLDGVTIKLALDKHFETELKVFKNDSNEILIQYKTFQGVIESTEMIRLSNSLNYSKPNLKNYFN